MREDLERRPLELVRAGLHGHVHGQVYGHHGGRQQGHGHQVSAVTQACTLCYTGYLLRWQQMEGGGLKVFSMLRDTMPRTRGMCFRSATSVRGRIDSVE